MIEKGAGDNVCDPGKIMSVKIAKVIEIKAKKGMEQKKTQYAK